MTLSAPVQRRFKQATALYIFQTQGQVTAVNVDHPLHFQLTQTARLLYALSCTGEYHSVPRLEEAAGRLMQFTRVTGGSGCTFRAETAWTRQDHEQLYGLCRQAESRGLGRLITPLTRAFDLMTLLRKPEHAANLLMPELERILRRLPARQSSKHKAFLVIAQHGSWISSIEQALEGAGLASCTQVSTRAVARGLPVQPAQTLVVVGAFADDDLPGLLTSARSADLVLLRYARPGDTMHGSGLFPLSATQVRRDTTVRVVPAPPSLREVTLPDVRVPTPAASQGTWTPDSGTPVPSALSSEPELPLSLTDLEEDAAFLNGTITTLPTRLGAAVEAWSLNLRTQEAQAATERIAGESGTASQALLVTLGGPRGPQHTFVEADARHAEVVLPDAARQAEVLAQSPSELMAGQYLLLRTEGGVLASRSVAKTQGGDPYKEADALRLEWRTAFKRRVYLQNEKFADVAALINKCGVFQGPMQRVSKELVRSWYRDDTLKRPDLDSHFEAVLEYAGFPVCGPESRLPEFSQAMSLLVSAHISAGSHVTDVLLEHITGQDVTFLMDTGMQTFTLEHQPKAGKFTAFEVLDIRPYPLPVNSRTFGVVFQGAAPDDT